MFKPSWVLMTALLSLSAFAEVTIEEKVNRVEYIEQLASQTQSMNIEAWHRELEYEKNNLSIEMRAKNEANLLAEKIKVQVQKAYEVALKNKSHEEAILEVKAAIEKDIILVDPKLADDIREIAMESLEGVGAGAMSATVSLSKLEKSMLSQVQERSDYLNEEAESSDLKAMMSGPFFPMNSLDPDAERREYNAKEELLESLASNRGSARWVATSNMSMRTDVQEERAAQLNLQVKVEFLGVAIEAGPTISFRRKFSTSAYIMAEGLSPVVLPDGNFDFYKRSADGTILTQNGKAESRFMVFLCETSLHFDTEYSGSGGFSVAGSGVSGSISQTYESTVTLNSRRLFVPEYVNGKTVTIKFLSDLCHKEFLNTNVTNNLKVKDSLDIMMKNVVAGLRFSHPKTKCALDTHCYGWYNNEVLGLLKLQNFPRCVEEPREKFRACELRGLKNQNCTVYDDSGKRISSGQFEFKCDEGLTCVKYQDAGWLKPAKGKCMPKNPSTYVDPFEKVRREQNRVIHVELITR